MLANYKIISATPIIVDFDGPSYKTFIQSDARLHGTEIRLVVNCTKYAHIDGFLMYLHTIFSSSLWLYRL